MPLRRFIDDGGEDDARQDDETRGRIREIQAGLVAWQEGVDRRYHRVARLLTFLVVVSLMSIMLGYMLLQGQRWDSIRALCDRTNQQADATVGLLQDLNVSEKTLRLAMARYPHTPPLAHRDANGTVVPGPPEGYDGPMSCSEEADDRVGRLRL